MKAVRLKTFHVSAKITLETSIEIKAATLEDAVVESRKLGIEDFIEIYGEHNDSSLYVDGVFESN